MKLKIYYKGCYEKNDWAEIYQFDIFFLMKQLKKDDAWITL